VSGVADVDCLPENYRDIFCWKIPQEQPKSAADTSGFTDKYSNSKL
jgi:hypothetical protein